MRASERRVCLLRALPRAAAQAAEEYGLCQLHDDHSVSVQSRLRLRHHVDGPHTRQVPLHELPHPSPALWDDRRGPEPRRHRGDGRPPALKLARSAHPAPLPAAPPAASQRRLRRAPDGRLPLPAPPPRRADPFDRQVWAIVATLLSFSAVAMLFFEYTAQNHGDFGPEYLHWTRRLGRGFYKVMMTYTMTGTFEPMTPAGRFYSVVFSFVVLLVQSAYTANLAAFFTRVNLTTQLVGSIDTIMARSAALPHCTALECDAGTLTPVCVCGGPSPEFLDSRPASAVVQLPGVRASRHRERGLGRVALSEHEGARVEAFGISWRRL